MPQRGRGNFVSYTSGVILNTFVLFGRQLEKIVHDSQVNIELQNFLAHQKELQSLSLVESIDVTDGSLSCLKGNLLHSFCCG